MVANTCRYFSGPLIPNSATVTVWNIGIKCLLEYLQVSATTLVSFLFIYMILLTVKLQIFLISVCLLFKKHNDCFKRKNGWRAPQGLINGTPISQYTSFSAMICPLHSNISKEQYEKHLCNPSSHYRKHGKYFFETCAPYLNV